MARSNSLAALLEAARADEDEAPTYPIPEAQIAELALVLREDAEIETFTKGDRVEYKHARGPLIPTAREKLVLVFWRYLDGDADARWIASASGGEKRVASNFDCLIGYIESGTFRFDPADSSGLRKVGRIA